MPVRLEPIASLHVLHVVPSIVGRLLWPRERNGLVLVARSASWRNFHASDSATTAACGEEPEEEGDSRTDRGVPGSGQGVLGECWCHIVFAAEACKR